MVSSCVVDYDKKYDVFYILKKKKDIFHSIDLGDFVIDLDKNNNIVGIEIFGISKMLNIPKKYLTLLAGSPLPKGRE